MAGQDAWQARVGPAWVEVDLDAIADNTRLVRGLLHPPCRLLAVVKANGYGHGADAVAGTVLEAGADSLGVSTVAEGLALRSAGVRAPILVLTPPRAVDALAAVEADLTCTVVSRDGAQALAAAGRRAGRTALAHLKCDAGMGRYGFDALGLAAAATELAGLEGQIRWEGVFTHFPAGADHRRTLAQLERFLGMVALAAERGLRFEVRHAAASAAVLAAPETHLDLVRVGTLLYGDRPLGVSAPTGLRRAFVLRAQAAQVRELAPGARVGYGGQWRARRPTRVAVFPVGYADGFGMAPEGPYRRPAVLLRALARAVLTALGLSSGLGAAAGSIEWGGRRLEPIGRIGMQQVSVACGTVPDEALRGPATLHVRATAVGAHLARVYLRDGVPVEAATASGRLASPAGARTGA